jgi:hypothetical protein
MMASFDAYEGAAADFITATPGLNVTGLVQTWDLYATMVDASAGASGTDGTGTDSISLYDCFNSTSSTCAGTDRFHYAEIFDTDSVTGELTRGEATVGVMVGPTEWSMVATYDATYDCMNTELYKLRTGATLVDAQQTTILTSGSAGYSKGGLQQGSGQVHDRRSRRGGVDAAHGRWQHRVVHDAVSIVG